MSLAFSRILFNMPPGSTGLHHLLQGGSRCSKHQVLALLMGIRDAPADEEEVSSILLPAMEDGHHRPVKEPGTFRALTHRQAQPILLSQHEAFHVTESKRCIPSGRASRACSANCQPFL